MKVIITVLKGLVILGLLVLAFLLGILITTPLEVQREILGTCPACICDCGDVYVDCCCLTEEPCITPTTTPTEQADTTPSATRSSVTPTRAYFQTPTQPSPSRTPPPTITTAPGTPTPTVPTKVSATPTDVATHTPTPASSPTNVPTATQSLPTPVDCFQWLCHKPGMAAEQDYCCESQGCVNAHLKHGDYLGRCLDG